MAGQVNKEAMQGPETNLRDPLAGSPGGIGCVGPDLPVDLLSASGLWHGQLPWYPSPATAWADRWLESAFPGWARSVLEQWHAGRFDGLSRVLFSRADDASQRLYYYVQELQRLGELRGPRPMIFDIALLPRESSLAHTEQAIRQLAAELGVGEEQAAAGIGRTNVLRDQLAAVQAARVAAGPAYEALARAVLCGDAAQCLQQFAPPASQARPRVLLAGSVPPDGRLHVAIEQAGASVIAEAQVFGLGRLGPALSLDDASPFRALARHLRTCSMAPRSVIDRAQWLLDQARQARAGAVVLWLTREEESLAWHVPAQRRALEDAGIPALVLTARTWLADDGALEEIATFCRRSFA
jgi:hypothetical protein